MRDQKAVVSDLMRRSEQLAPLRELANMHPFLSQTEQTLVRYVLQNPEAVASMSAAQLAAAADVSEATLFRLCRRPDVGGYARMRERIKEAVANLGGGFVKPIDVRQTEDPTLSPLHVGVYDGIRSLLDMAAIDGDDVEWAARAIAESTRLNVCGLGPITARLAEMTAFSFQRLGLTCMLWTDRQTLSHEMARFHNGDVVLALSYSGVNTFISDFMKEASDHGATTIAITNYAESPVAKAATMALTTYVREIDVQNFDLLPRMSQLVIVQTLVNVVRCRVDKPDDR